MKRTIKVAVTGSAGQIGYALLFRIASGQMFGPETLVDLHLIDIKPGLEALQGVVMELRDCAFPLLNNIVTTTDLNVGFRDVNWAILVGAAPRKAGMERSDLLKINGGIFTTQGQAINDNAASDVRVFVVGNPCNTNCLIAMNNAPDIPNDRFYAMTMLDQNRARYQLAAHADVAITAVDNMIIWGNHSATQFPDFYHATIDGKLVTDVIKDHQWLENEFMSTVQQRGAAVIKARGASSAASAANAIIDSINCLTTDDQQSFSVCCCSQGQYGVDEGLIYSFPCQQLNGKTTIITGIEHQEAAQQYLTKTLNELRQERDTVKSLGLIKA